MKNLSKTQLEMVSGGNWFSDVYDAVYYTTYDAVSAVGDFVSDLYDDADNGGSTGSTGFDFEGCHNQCPW